ncbi:MAG: RecQ family ATP-dependent DNA helicase [Mediterranea massiliensis]|nr:RecQ family ATP-dependent DNA helicase [Mediterranea massiliensis]
MYIELLKQYWGYNTFRGIQKEIIESVIQKKDTLGLMPTGGGKSITFQLPTMAMEGLCLVITPLIALMKDQVQNLKKRGIKALSIHSGMTRQEIVTTLENCIFGNYKFLYISPERIDTEIFQTKLRKMRICLITVDESHCISQWGYDFRPAYLKIAEIRKLLPDVPILALTATATPEVVKDIQAKLHFKKENVFRMSFERTNLAYIVRKTENKLGELLNILRNLNGSSIVYVRNRRRTKEVAEFLNKESIRAEFYHAGLDDATKDIRQHLWQTGKSRVMVATNAFGMGIDKSDVQLVVHIDLPDSIEAYFQEAGRAGRNGEKAYAVILYSNSDKTTLQKRIPDTFPEKSYIKDVYEKLQYYYQMAMGDGKGCIKEFNIEDFCRKFKFFPVQVDSALKILTQAGYLEYTDEQNNASRILFTLNREELYKLHEMGDDMELLIQTLLRSYTGLFTDYTFINEESLAVRTGFSRQKVYELLIRLSKMRILNYIPKKKTPYILYAQERVEKKNIHISKDIYEERKERYIKRMNSILDYTTTEVACRSRILLHYFGEYNEHNCGFCDTCIALRKGEKMYSSLNQTDIEDKILTLVAKQSITPNVLAEHIACDKEEIVKVLHQLLDIQKLRMRDGIITLQ